MKGVIAPTKCPGGKRKLTIGFAMAIVRSFEDYVAAMLSKPTL